MLLVIVSKWLYGYTVYMNDCRIRDRRILPRSVSFLNNLYIQVHIAVYDIASVACICIIAVLRGKQPSIISSIL